MATEEETMEVLKLKRVHGVMLATFEMVKPKHIMEALTYKAKDGDVVLDSYVKTGSTWLMYIVWEILHKGAQYPGISESIQKHIPNIEFTGSGPVEDLQPPRFYRHHLACNLMQLNPKAKYIYIHRKPEDVVASFYHYIKMHVERKDFDIDFFFEAFMKGLVWYDDYFDHLRAAYEHRNDKNFLFLSYEKLRSDTRSEILRIAEFIGEEYSNPLKTDEELLAKILKVTSFDYMKKNLIFDMPVVKEGEKKSVDFFRKGVAGDGKNLLKPEHRERLDAKIREKLAGTEFVDAWLS